MRRETLTQDPAARMREDDLLRCITDAATILGWSWVHFRAAETRHGWRTPVAGPLGKGWPDLFLARPRDGRLLAIEAKSDSGRVTLDQSAVHEVLRAAGLDVRVVHPADLDAVLESLR